MKPNSMTYAEAGRLGGLATSKKHGKAHYEKIGVKGGQKTAERYKKRSEQAGVEQEGVQEGVEDGPSGIR